MAGNTNQAVFSGRSTLLVCTIELECTLRGERSKMYTLALTCRQVKGKRAHNFTISYLLLIPCLLDRAKTLVTENNANIGMICIYRGKEILFGDPNILGFPISPCATSLEGNPLKIKKGILGYDKPLNINSKYKEK